MKQKREYIISKDGIVNEKTDVIICTVYWKENKEEK